MRQNIPAELRALPQWVVSGASKIPFNPRNGQVASPTDPATWATFEEALATGAPNLGFVLTKEDPYCIIDLDDKPSKPASPEAKARHTAMLDFFQSYTEISQSGNGYHIVLKGALPSGVNRDNVEMYSDARYIIFTGNVVKNLPIADGYQQTLDNMYGAMRPEDSIELIEVDEVVSDQEIYDMASTAENAEKFNALCGNNWHTLGYESGSEADLALLSILAFYTRSDEQCRRLFRFTPLGSREKDGRPRHHTDSAINFALRKIRAKQPPPVDLDKIVQSMTMPKVNGYHNPKMDFPLVDQPPPPAPVPVHQMSNLTLPPGLVGEVAQFVYATSIRPVPEIALATAIAFVAGIAGRAYNTNTRSGLSQYIALLAKTGTGKEAAASSISTLLMAVRSKIPAATDFMGPSVFASGPALHRVLAAKPCFVSVLGEFGLLLQKMSNRNANTADMTLKKTLLDSYGKSGYGNILQPSVYSDKEKDVAAIQSPNITILGESTPESFYDSLDEGAVTSGFLPRFFIIEYFGERPDRNPNAGNPPSEQLLNKVSELISCAVQANHNGACMPVRNDVHAQKELDNFDHECDTKMRGQGDVLAEVWNRAHLKALKLAALLAVGCNPYEPVVTVQMAQWAIDLIRNDSQRLADRFRAGDVGEGDAKQQAEIIRVVKEYLNSANDDASIKKYHTTPQLKLTGLVPARYLQRRLYNVAAFKNDRRGANEALNKAVQGLKEAGMLAELDTMTLRSKYQYEGKAYALYRG